MRKKYFFVGLGAVIITVLALAVNFLADHHGARFGAWNLTAVPGVGPEGEAAAVIAQAETTSPFAASNGGNGQAEGNGDSSLDKKAGGISFGIHSNDRKKKYTVNFINAAGEVLSSQSVSYRESAEAPSMPAVAPGEVFTGWSEDFNKVTENMVVKEETISVADVPNAIAIHSGYCKKGDTVTVPLQLCGKVCLCGLDISIRFDPQVLRFKEFAFEDDDAICNYDNNVGEIKLNYLTPHNVTADVDLCDMVFESVGKTGKTRLSITVKELIAFDENDEIYTPKYRAVEGTVQIVK